MEDTRTLLTTLRGRYNQRELAEALGITTRTLRRWQVGETEPPLYAADAIRQRLLPLTGHSGTKIVARNTTMSEATTVPARAFPSKGNWTDEQLKLAFHFYCQTPFGKLHSRNKQIIELANLIGRTPSALAMKLVNFASLDPSITDTGRKGLTGASAQDRKIWDEFHADWERLTVECEQLRAYLLKGHEQAPEPLLGNEDDFALGDYTGETRQAIVWQRIKQDFFRRAVLASYRGRCCISGISDQRFLIASHIVPWRQDKANRLNPSNGLCLSAIHDKAFDQHLFSLTDNHRIVLSKQLKASKDTFLQEVFWPTEDRLIELPERFRPEQAFIRSHREAMLRSET